jgi:hypothetical protein
MDKGKGSDGGGLLLPLSFRICSDNKKEEERA